ncbi:MAG: MmcQ/YjbR family DNA-binding protein [Planctomycetes bacterium]|nr:MmcQ/YjbR family DNA-binding protein [Planctomycetota bacterium]
MKESEILARLRAICLDLPEVRETTKWGHPTFEAGKKMFAVLDQYEDRVCIAFRVPQDRLAEVLSDERFFAAPYAARYGWVCMYADGRLNWREVKELLLGSYRQVALKRMLAALECGDSSPL